MMSSNRVLQLCWVAVLTAVALFAGAVVVTTRTSDAAAVEDPLSLDNRIRHAQLTLANCRLLQQKAPYASQRARADLCVVDQQRTLILLQEEQTGTPTPAPTTATPTRTAAPTSTPTRTTAPPPTTNPPVTGWPTSNNTGVPAGTTLTTYTGPLTITAAGTVIDGKTTGCLRIQASGVLIRNSRIRCTSDYPLRVVSGDVNVTDSEIDGTGNTSDCVVFGNFKLLRVEVRGCADGAKAGSNVRIEDSWIHDPTGCSGCHNDTIQSEGGENVVIRHNTLENPYSQTGVIKLGTAQGPLRNYTVQDNLFNGGGYTVYAGGDDGIVENLRFIGNRWGRQFYPQCGYWGPVSYWRPANPGSVWTDNRWVDGGVING